MYVDGTNDHHETNDLSSEEEDPNNTNISMFSNNAPTETTCDSDIQSNNTEYETYNFIDTMKKTRNQYKEEIIISYLSINSIRHKILECHDMLYYKLSDIIAFSETKLDSNIHVKLKWDCYRLYRKDHKHNSGGLLLYVNTNFPSKRLKRFESEEFESLSIEIDIKGEKTFLCSLYRNPKSSVNNFINHLENLTEKVLRKYSKVIFMGDMNINLLIDDSECKALKDYCDTYDMVNIITEPTCHKGNSETMIDLILTNDNQSVVECGTVDTGISDYHSLIYCAMPGMARPPTKTKITYRSFKQFEEDHFLADISKYITPDVENFNDLSHIFSIICDKHAPLKTKYIKSKQLPYMNSKLRKAIVRKSMLWHRFLKRKTKKNILAFQAQRNLSTSIQRKSISTYFAEKCGKKDKHFWEVMRPFLSEKCNDTNQADFMLQEGDRYITDITEVCEVFNHNFIKTGESQKFTLSEKEKSEEFNKCLNNIKHNCAEERNFVFKAIEPETVRKKITKIKSKKAAGYDLIPPKLVKIASQELYIPLTNVLNSSLGNSNFPDQMKYANISPAYKKNEPLEKGNYRPISVLTCFSKLFEGIIADQMNDFFNPILSAYISAFRSGYSCQSLLLKMTEDWRENLDNHKCVGALMIDLSKAFDTINHDKLLSKLKQYGFSESAIYMLTSYLKGRKQRVKIGSNVSNWEDIRSGIPQGSVLGPLIFNIFMNDVFYAIHDCQLYNYADDNTMSHADEDILKVQSVLQCEAQNIMIWFDANDLSANPQKFQSMVLGSDENMTIKLGEHTIMNTKTNKIVGVTIDDELKFDQHVTLICKKAARQLNVLRKFSHILDSDARMTVYKSFILSNFNFCPLIWHFCGIGNTRKLEKIQKRALRFVLQDFTSNYSELLQKAKMPTLYLSRLRQIATEVYKVMNNIGPDYVKDIFNVKDNLYNMRNTRPLIQPNYNTVTYGRNSIKYKGAMIWNKLPKDIKEALSLKQFKNMIKKWEGPSCSCNMCDKLLQMN